MMLTATCSTQTDRTGAKTTYTYDANNRMVSSVDALGQTTHYSYDEVGNLISTTTPEGNQTSTEYDTLNHGQFLH